MVTETGVEAGAGGKPRTEVDHLLTMSEPAFECGLGDEEGAPADMQSDSMFSAIPSVRVALHSSTLALISLALTRQDLVYSKSSAIASLFVQCVP